MAGIAVCLPVELFAVRVPPSEFLFCSRRAVINALCERVAVNTQGLEEELEAHTLTVLVLSPSLKRPTRRSTSITFHLCRVEL